MKFFDDYFSTFANTMRQVDPEMLLDASERFKAVSAAGGKIVLAGNGGSASIVSHATFDLTINAGIRAVNFNEAVLLTCLSNDYGYENWVERALAMYADPGDLVVLISSSGQSQNMLNGAQRAKDLGLQLITFSGFKADNPLRQMGDLNFWVESSIYNFVEGVHSCWLLSLVDRIITDNGGKIGKQIERDAAAED